MALSPGTALQSASVSSISDKWVTAVADLMELTQKHQLLWREDPIPRTPYLGPCYMTEFNGNTLILQGKPLPKWDEKNALLHALIGLSGSNYVLRVFKPDGELLLTFPSVAALNGLKIAIDGQLHSEEDSFLEAIHQAIKKNDE